ncbi:metallophosphoesterase [Bacillus sp. REN16]|uniref:metallophosphoesterase n=1 Tax=Bacillus sp. REN16 TaxID=2887296 RepID=UPI001E46EC07|nr:metallophosphoesterase [Bacillus sp. REN16]MCC3358220.1 metallophosphoesterase [Bacillus sp. REN16]
MKIETKLHTIYLLIGPTECGKSTFAKNVLIPQLQFYDEEKNYRSNVQYLSSDEIRQEILGFPYDKYDSMMMESSAQAFDLLFHKLMAVTSFPVNADFVIVDTTGLADDFRKKVAAIAKENHYRLEAIAFDYKNMKDYFASDRSKKVIATHVNRMRRDVLPTLRRSDFDDIHRIHEKNFLHTTAYEIVVENIQEYVNHILPQNYFYIIIGDVHETLAPLQQMITLHGFTILDGKIQETSKSGNKRFVLIGDFIDKGKNTKATIEFLYHNREFFYFVKGNHENFVSKYINGEIQNVDPQLLENFFTSIPVLAADLELQSKFQVLVDVSCDFYRFIGKKNNSFYLTHAPCHNQYIGKMDATSRRHQRRFATNFEADIEEQLRFLEKESGSNFPYHVFGHVATKEVVRMKNKIGIDTGCVSGNALTSLTLQSYKPLFKSVPSSDKTANEEPELSGDNTPFSNELPAAFSSKAKKVKLIELSENDQKRLDYILQNKVNFVSGTMSPADKDFRTNELESLPKGLDYFKEAGVSEVVLQPKYMGSRCNIYLSQDVEKCNAVSRNGYKITHIDLTQVFCQLQAKFSTLMDEKAIDMIIFDGELLPWNALGKGLIDQQFDVVAKALETEIGFLKEFGFENHFLDVVRRYESSGFEEAMSRNSKKDLIAHFGMNDYQTFKDLKEIIDTTHTLSEQEKSYLLFRKQLDLYAKDQELTYKPFSILKVVYSNGNEEIPVMKTSEMFSFISDDEYMIVNLQDPYDNALEFFKKLTFERGMEGVVIKPEVPKVNLVPFMKVRNPEYLTLVYGYDYRFPHKYTKLMKQKNIKKKIQKSLIEHKLGMKMLQTRLDEIGPENLEYKQTVANLIFEESQEQDIDPRL